eukprot:3935839-Rhodomonas_salina.1
MMLEERLRSDSPPRIFEGVTVTHSIFTAELKYELGLVDRSAETKYMWQIHVFHYPEGVMGSFRRMFGNDSETVGTLSERIAGWLATLAPHLAADA